MRVERVAEIIRLMKPSVPINLEIWSPEDIAKYMDITKQQFSNKYAVMPDFPEAKRLPTKNGKGQLRWMAKDVIEWVESQ